MTAQSDQQAATVASTGSPLLAVSDNAEEEEGGKSSRACQLTAHIAYDGFALCLSLADVVTDMLVALQFYRASQWTLFYVSVAIFSVAQLVYTLMFLFTFYRNKSFVAQCSMFVAYLPFAPLTGVIYLAIDTSAHFRRALEWMGFAVDIWRKSKRSLTSADGVAELDLSSSWFREKTHAHMGFMLEALFEAFPQSILQLIAVVYYGRTSPLSMVSILLSLLSACSKTLVLSHSLSVASYLFFWLSFVADAFLLFAIIAWLFFDASVDHLLSTAWLVKFVAIDVTGALWYTIWMFGTFKLDTVFASIDDVSLRHAAGWI